MSVEENTFSFADQTGSEAQAPEPVAHAAHMAPADTTAEALSEDAVAAETVPAPAPEPELDELEAVAMAVAAEPTTTAAEAIEAAGLGDAGSSASEEADAEAEAAFEPTGGAGIPAFVAPYATKAETMPATYADAAGASEVADATLPAFEREAKREVTLASNTDSDIDSLAASAADKADAEPADAAAVPAEEPIGAHAAPSEETSADETPEPQPQAEPSSLPTASLDDTAEIDVDQVEAKLKDPGSTQSFEPITEERIDTGSTYDAGTTTTLMWGARSDVGCVRSHNEDSYLVQSPLFAVCDGMGGHAAGEVASSIAVETIAKMAPSSADPAQLAAAVEAANAAIITAADNGLGKAGMGCTATAAYLEGNSIAIAHVGDSRAYLLHEGTLIRVTRDHSYVEELVDAGEITADEARVHPNRSVITRALGSDPAMYADHFCLNIEQGDRLILCSDGMSSMVPDGEIECIATKSSTAQICVDNLVDAALAAGGHDNVTVIAVDVVDDGRIKKILGRRRRVATIAICMLVAAIAVAAIAAFFAVRNSVYIGINEADDTVAVYTGVHAELFGCKLYSLEDTTSVKVHDLPDDTRKRLDEGIEQESVEAARNTISQYRTQIDEEETKQVETAEVLKNSTEEGSTDAAGSDSSSDDSAADATAPADTSATDTDNTNEGGA